MFRTRHRRAALALIALMAAVLVPAVPASGSRSQAAGGAGGDPTARLYVTNSLSADISAFDIGATGHPTLDPDRVPAGTGVRGLVFTPDGRFAYAANAGADTIGSYAVEEDGDLRPLGSPTPSGGEGALGIAVSPTGQTLYVAHRFDNKVAAFTIEPDGTLSPLGEPVPMPGQSPRGVTVSPDGRLLFVGHGVAPTSANDGVTIVDLGPNGEPRPRTTPIVLGSFCGAASVSPDSRLLYVLCQGSDNVYGFAIEDGDLEPVPGSPFPVADFPEGVTITPDGRYLYVANVGTQRPDVGRDVSAFRVEADGALTPLGDPTTAGLGPVAATTTPDGRHLYVSNFDSHELSAYSISADGTLDALPGTPTATGGRGPGFQSISVLPNQGPVASLAVQTAGDRRVVLDGSGSTDADGRVVRYAWDFGDGETAVTSAPSTTHRYRTAGVYSVTLTVTDDEGCSTDLVFTGQSALCNGSAAATTVRPATAG